MHPILALNKMALSQSKVGRARFLSTSYLYVLAFLPFSETAAVPLAAPQRRAEVHSSVFEVPSSARNVFPAVNFNRDVTTNWWDTEILDGHTSEPASDLAASLKNASFIVLDQDFYRVSICC